MARRVADRAQRMERRIAELRPSGGGDRLSRLGLIAGVLLGAIIGALLVRFFMSREDEVEIPEEPAAGDDAIVLRERPGRAVPAEESPIALPFAPEGGSEPAAEPAAEAQGSEQAVYPATEANPDVIPAASGMNATGMVEPVDGACPATHPIKGNHGSSGEFIYHLPDGRLYERTNAEACFATAADAEAAGYRQSKV